MPTVQQARPIAGHVFISRLVKTETESGLALTPEKESTVYEGVVKAFGAGVKPGCGLGTKVLFKPWQSSEVEVEPGVFVFTVPAEDLLAVWEE